MPDLPAPTDDMNDPMEQILKDMRTRPDDALFLAQFLDLSVMARVFQEMGYTAEDRIRRLVQIAKDGSNSESMRAMKILEDMQDTAMTRRGILVGKSPSGMSGLPTDPVGMPQPIRSIEAEETTRRIRTTFDAIPEESEVEQPLLPEIDNGQKEEDEDDEFYEDDRASSVNTHRPPSRSFDGN